MAHEVDESQGKKAEVRMENGRPVSERKQWCGYCGEDYTDPDGHASDDYMWAGHIINDCEEVPDEVRDEVNGPPPTNDE